MRFLSSVAVLGVLAFASQAQAQEASPNGKGVIGGSLLGAELVLSLEAAFDVQSTWAYVGGGLAGGVAGGVGGYFIERESSARVPMLMLAAGMALAIPTTVAILSATAYEPPKDYVLDRPPADEPVADPPRAPQDPQLTAPTPTGMRRKHRSTGVVHRPAPALVGFEPERVTLSLPTFSLHDVYSKQEVATLGVKQATEVRVPVVNVLF